MKNEDKYTEARKMLCSYLRELALAKNITHYEIADKTGFSANNISRMLQGHYSPSLDNFMKLAEAVGVYFFVADKDDENSELTETMKNRWGKLMDN